MLASDATIERLDKAALNALGCRGIGWLKHVRVGAIICLDVEAVYSTI